MSFSSAAPEKSGGVSVPGAPRRVILGLGSNRAFVPAAGAGRDAHATRATGALPGRGASGPALSPERVLSAACATLEDFLAPLTLSSVYRTKAMYVTEQDDFFNMAAIGFFHGTPEELLVRVQAVEAAFGRDRSREYRNGPRTLDIDIEFFEGETRDTPELTIPHPRLLERRFILEPLVEILTEPSDNELKQQLAAALRLLPDQGVMLYGKCGGSEFGESGKRN